jgi:hypothetical protein
LWGGGGHFRTKAVDRNLNYLELEKKPLLETSGWFLWMVSEKVRMEGGREGGGGGKNTSLKKCTAVKGLLTQLHIFGIKLCKRTVIVCVYRSEIS